MVKPYSYYLNQKKLSTFALEALLFSVVTFFYYQFKGPAATLAFGFGIAITSLAIWLGGAWLQRQRAIRHEVKANKWQVDMLNAIRLAKEGDEYFAGNANIISALHDRVTTLEREGIAKRYLDIGRL